MSVYHVTNSENRKSIREQGLLAYDTTRHHFCGAVLNAGVECVFAFTTLSAAREWALGNFYAKGPDDIWEIDADGLDVEPDPYCGHGYPLTHALRILSAVPPERLTLLEEEKDD